MKTLSHLQNEAIERFEKAWVTSYGKIIYGETGFLTTDAGEPFRIEKDLVRDFLKTELETIVKESFKNTRVEEKKRKPTHGTCCTCQDCGYPNDYECECARNKVLEEVHNIQNQFLNN